MKEGLKQILLTDLTENRSRKVVLPLTKIPVSVQGWKVRLVPLQTPLIFYVKALMNLLKMYTEVAINFVIWIIFGGRLKSMLPTRMTQNYISRSPCTGLQTISLHRPGGKNSITTKVIKNRTKECSYWVTAATNLLSILSICRN